MKNITVKISPDELTAIVKAHIEKKLAPDTRANVVMIYGGNEGTTTSPNTPTMALNVTFDIVS